MIDGVGKGDPLGTGYTDYGSLGHYTISGSIPDPGGLQAPTAVATTNTSPGNAPLSVTFSGDASTDNDGDIVSYDWDFGDGESLTAPNPVHIYTAPGSYTATLTVTDNDGLSDSDTVNITVINQAPVAVASADMTSGVAPLEVTFSGSGSYDRDEPNGSIAGYSWDFGDGASSTDANPVHSYTSAGTYSATLTVTDDLGDTDSATTDPIVVTPPPVVDQYATGETYGAGAVSGSYTDTHVNDGVAEWVQETESGGKPSRRHSYLEHFWTFNVQPGNAVTLFLNAWMSNSSDGDDMDFSYSTDGGATYLDGVTIGNTSDSGLVSVPLLPGTQGNVIIRVRDTDRSQGNRSLDTLYIDEMFIRTENQTGGIPPIAPTALEGVAISSGQVDLDWTDNSSDEYGFHIEHSIDDGGSWSLLDSVGEGVANYSDFSVTPGTTYGYRVAAYNGYGQSASSNVVEVATPDDPGNPITLSAVGYKLKGVQHAELEWSGSEVTSVDVYRDGSPSPILTTSENPYTDNIGIKGGGSYIYQVCDAETGSCSEQVTVTF